jgi:phage shock protein PspC (stress-responsive transcriptional regulator)
MMNFKNLGGSGRDLSGEVAGLGEYMKLSFRRIRIIFQSTTP